MKYHRLNENFQFLTMVFFTTDRGVYNLVMSPAPTPSLRERQPMGPQPRDFQPNDISLYESLGIAFFEALFWSVG